MKKRKGSNSYHRTMQCKGERGYGSKEEADVVADKGFNQQTIRCKINGCGKYHVVDEWPQHVMAKLFSRIEQERRSRL